MLYNKFILETHIMQFQMPTFVLFFFFGTTSILFIVKSQNKINILCFHSGTLKGLTLTGLHSDNCDWFLHEQGSSENDGRSDVYDCSEFKVISNCCYNNCCHTNCSHFTCIYLNLPKFTWIYLNLPKFT